MMKSMKSQKKEKDRPLMDKKPLSFNKNVEPFILLGFVTVFTGFIQSINPLEFIVVRTL